MIADFILPKYCNQNTIPRRIESITGLMEVPILILPCIKQFWIFLERRKQQPILSCRIPIGSIHMSFISHYKLNAVRFTISAFNTLSFYKFMIF